MAANYHKNLYNEYDQLMGQYEKKNEELQYLKYEHQLLKSKNKTLEKKAEAYALANEKKEAENQELRREVERLLALRNTDGHNSSLPTSRTPIHKKKTIPNSRKKTGRTIGGQPGHEKHRLAGFDETGITETILHKPEACPNCHSAELEEKRILFKDELDYRIVVEKKRHYFNEYQCTGCGETVREQIPVYLKEENQYGPQAKALALSLGNLGNVSMNKIKKLIEGLTGGEICMSEGYIAKLQGKAVQALEPFETEVRNEIIKKKLVYWDDTVVMINKRRGCLRFYGDEETALYKGHLKKTRRDWIKTVY